jgi:hypothetical protein
MMSQPQPIYDLVTAALAELGIPPPSDIVESTLMRNGYFVGHKLRYNGGHAIWMAGGNTVEVYDEHDNLLKTVAFAAEAGAAA